VTWAIVNVRYARKKEREDEKVRLERYERYLVQCADRIREKYEFNQKSLREMYPDALTCSGYTAQSAEIWSRKPTHSDLLYVRLGLGEMPFQVKITVPKQGFTLTDDELTERPEKIAERYEVLNDVPVGVALKDYNVVGILTGSDKRAALDLVRVMIAQIAANHSYTDVKLCVLYDGSKDTAEQWGYVRWLPHVWNEERSMRYVADDQSGINDVLYSLAQVLRARLEQSLGNFGSKPEFLPKYVLIVELVYDF
jgi:S-DNA-T family DNA segregation ATPase FtsK/SpoIIIE